MTPEKLQEAIGLLPSDLVAEADEKRNQLPKKKSQWKPIAAMAACFALVLACGLFLTRMGMGGSAKMKLDSNVMKMLDGFTILRASNMVSMVGATLTKEQLLRLNKQLNHIKKPNK